MSSNLSLKKVCIFCGNIFIAKTTVTKFCGQKCRKSDMRHRRRELTIQSSDQQVKAVEAASKPKTLVAEFLTVSKASKLLNMSTRGIYHMIHSGRLKAIRLTERKTLVKRADIDEMLVLAEFQPPVLKERKKIRTQNFAILWQKRNMRLIYPRRHYMSYLSEIISLNTRKVSIATC